MAARRSGTRLFLRNATQHFHQTGAIAPSSRFLARAITAMIPAGARPVRVLEAGAGTGALTSEILGRLAPGSRLDIYEVNPTFAEHLARRFADAGRGRRIQVSVHNRRVQELPAGACYDAVISGLPLNNFRPSEVKGILKTLLAAVRPGGTLSYFEYLLIREIKSLATVRRERRRLRRVGAVASGFIARYELRRDPVLLNIPPAMVHHLVRPADAGDLT